MEGEEVKFEVLSNILMASKYINVIAEHTEFTWFQCFALVFNVEK